MHQSRTLDLGMDVHNDAMAVADVATDDAAAVVSLGTIATRHGDSDQLIHNRPSQANQLILVDEAGPCGDWLSRDRRNTGDACGVVAPSRMPTKAGACVKTDRRAAVPRARLMRAGDLTPVDVSTAADEARRALTRAREAALRALKAAPVRLNAFWLRHDIREAGRAHGGPAPRRWLAEVGCPTPAPQLGCQASVRAVTEPTERLQRLAQALHAQVNAWRLQPVVEALQALRGVQCTVAVTTVAALGDLTRCENPRQLMKCLGRIPSADSRAERRRPGSITTAGHTHARRALVEGAGAYRDPANVSRHLQRRLDTPPKAIQDRSGNAQVRRCTRVRRLLARGQQATPVVVALARELVGCLWAIATQMPVTPSGPLTTGACSHH